jgi:hypothetical protein
MRRVLLAAVAVLQGCTAETPMPGDEEMGTYAFTATPLELNCEVGDIPEGGFSFTGTWSRDTSTGEAWYRLNNVVSQASFDGQVATVSYTAPRTFGGPCEGCSTELRETVTVAILSKSQNDAAGDLCPTDVLDGGLPQGEGITPPGALARGYDALRACGELVNEIVATPLEGASCDPACGACRLRYHLAGARR